MIKQCFLETLHSIVNTSCSIYIFIQITLIDAFPVSSPCRDQAHCPTEIQTSWSTLQQPVATQPHPSPHPLSANRRWIVINFCSIVSGLHNSKFTDSHAEIHFCAIKFTALLWKISQFDLLFLPVRSPLSCQQSQRRKVVEEQVINRRLQQELLERETQQMWEWKWRTKAEEDNSVRGQRGNMNV